MDNLINTYVVWSFDGPIMTTLLQFDSDDMTRQWIQTLSTQDYVEMSFDVEFPECINEIKEGGSYEIAAIFTCDNINFIY